MKKILVLVTAVLLAVFMIGQSFYYRANRSTTGNTNTSFKGYPQNVAMCAGIGFRDIDSLKDIQALKGWGNFKWTVTGAKDSAQFYFNQGISLYYAFHNIESIASFAKATRFAPDCAMAWYGKALAMGPTINYDNGYVAPKGALEAALRSKQLAANCTPLEKALIDAIQVRYSADSTADVMELKKNYATAMQQVYRQFGQDANAITLYADSRMLLHPWDLYDHDFNPKPWTAEISGLLEKAIALSPKHPGANHFYIHTLEASAHPEKAMASANLLDTLMPLVSHMTHMPSHIYIRTGFYEKAIKVNDVAVAGYLNYLHSYAPVAGSEGLYEAHNNQLKSASAQMAGSYKVSIAAAEETKKNVIDNGYLALPGAWANLMQYAYSMPILTDVRFGKWDKVLQAPATDTLLYATVLRHFARGMAFSRKHNFPAAKQELKLMQEKMTDARLKADAGLFSNAYSAARVGELILSGVLAEEQKDLATATKTLEAAVIAEDYLIYNEPRDWTLPARHYLGEALLKNGQHAKAIAVFLKDLSISPRNGWSLTGLSLAYEATHNTAALKQTRQQLQAAWKIKDVAVTNPVF